jgi:micrococcal nuclease
MKTIKAIKLGGTGLLLVAIAVIFVVLQGADGETSVYVTNSGSKYHLDGCPALSRSKTGLTLSDALRSGYGACGICKPPSLDPAGPPASGSEAEQAPALYRVNTAALKTTAAAAARLMVRARAVAHIDGDTVRVHIPNPPAGLGAVETIRMIGVDTPETVYPGRPPEYFGKEAGDFTKTRLLGKNILLAFDWDLRDRYGRLLAYIYIDEENAPLYCHNAALIREGYGHAYTRFAFQFIEEFRALEQEARTKKRGLWR